MNNTMFMAGRAHGDCEAGHVHYAHEETTASAAGAAVARAAALVGTMEEEEKPWQVKDTGACLIPDSEDAMSWALTLGIRRFQGFFIDRVVERKAEKMLQARLDGRS